MRRYFLAYATANDRGDFYWDSITFGNLAGSDPGVPLVDVFVTVSEAVPRTAAHERAVDALRATLAPSSQYRFRGASFKPNPGRDFSSFRQCLARILEDGAPDDYVLCFNRSACGPLGDGWYAAFVRQLEHAPDIGLCGNSINFQGPRRVVSPEYTHVQSYAFLARAGELARHMEGLPALTATTRHDAVVGGEIPLSRRFLREGRGITCLAWPHRVFFEDRCHDPALPQEDVSFRLTTTPFRHWLREEYASPAHWPGRARWFFARARGAMRNSLRAALARPALGSSRVVHVSPASPHGTTTLAPGAYLLSCTCPGTVGVAIGSPARPRNRVFFYLYPGANLHLVSLRSSDSGHVVSLLGPGCAGAPPLELVFTPAGRLRYYVLTLLRERDGILRVTRFRAGRHAHLKPDAVNVSGAWLDWAASLPQLALLGLEEATPTSALMAPAGSGVEAGAAPAVAAAPEAGERIGVHLHLHYHDLWEEIRAHLAHLPSGAGLHLTTDRRDDAFFAAVREVFPGACIEVVENRGRDIAPFVRLLNEGAFDRYDCVCKLHGKKSALASGETYFGRAWRRRALADLVGCGTQVRRIVEMFRGDPQLGVLGPAVLRRPRAYLGPGDGLGRNRELVDMLLTRHGGQGAVAARLDYFAGSMFWFRPRALDRVRALGIATADFPEERQQIDGTLAHALERVIPTSAALSGFRIEGVTL